jgi:RNA polymerase sigma factor (sigma-70 family)
LTEIDKLLSDCKAGNQKAYEVLYKKYYRVLYGIALRYCRTTFEADDIIQESFIKIFQNIKNFNEQGSFEGWIKRIVQNTAINNYRDNLKFNLNKDITENNVSIEDTSFDDIFDAFEAKEIITLLNQLPEGYRIVINLYIIDGYSHKEIAELLKISVGTSKSQLFKAKEFLKKNIEANYKKEIA